MSTAGVTENSVLIPAQGSTAESEACGVMVVGGRWGSGGGCQEGAEPLYVGLFLCT